MNDEEFSDFTTPDYSSAFDSVLSVSTNHDYIGNELRLHNASEMTACERFNRCLANHIDAVKSLLSVQHSEHQLMVLSANFGFLHHIR